MIRRHGSERAEKAIVTSGASPVRMGYWEQWGKTRRRVRELLRLGTGKRQAIFTALSRKSYWHLSKTLALATQPGMTNDWLERQGLLSIRSLWMKPHGYV